MKRQGTAATMTRSHHMDWGAPGRNKRAGRGALGQAGLPGADGLEAAVPFSSTRTPLTAPLAPLTPILTLMLTLGRVLNNKAHTSPGTQGRLGTRGRHDALRCRIAGVPRVEVAPVGGLTGGLQPLDQHGPQLGQLLTVVIVRGIVFEVFINFLIEGFF